MNYSLRERETFTLMLQNIYIPSRIRNRKTNQRTRSGPWQQSQKSKKPGYVRKKNAFNIATSVVQRNLPWELHF